MKLYTRIIAFALAMITTLTLIGCHEKGETVLTVGDTAIPSGLYIAFQVEGYNKLMEGINSQLEASSATSEITKYADYFNYTYEDQTAVDYINSQALATAVEYALIQQKYKEYGLELDKEQTDYVQSYAQYYWENGEKNMYEPFGVSFESYKELLTFRSMKSVVFEYYYNKKNEETGKGGLYAVSDKELKETLGKNYFLADSITIGLTPSSESGVTEYTEDQIASFKKELEDHAKKYNSGTSFAEIYKGIYGQEPQSNVDAESDVKTIYPTSASVYSAEDSDITMHTLLKAKAEEKGFKYETAYVVGGEAENQYSMVVLYDIAKDPYYLEQNRSALLYDLKDAEFTAKLAEEGKALAVTKNQDLIDFYKPTNIDYDSIAAEQQ